MRLVFLLILFALALVWFALSPQARAVCQNGCDTVNYSTFLGNDVLINNTTGVENTAIGESALNQNTTGSLNTAIGSIALSFNTTGSFNTATGDRALIQNTTGNYNTANGVFALSDNGPGENNTATGYSALEGNQIGGNNTATGANSLRINFTGSNNTANGFGALDGNPFGSQNTGTGAYALGHLQNGVWRGSSNTAIGFAALNTFRDGDFNIALGSRAGESLREGSNNLYIANEGVAFEANTIRVGTVGIQKATYIAGIRGATVPTGVAVIVDAEGHLGTTTSSARFKDAIKPMDKASEAILSLKPVTFHYKKDLDPKGIPQFGLVAEDVEKVNPDLVARDVDGKAFTVRYDAVNAMLLNEFL